MLQVEKRFHSYEYYRSDYLIQTENITKDWKEKDERKYGYTQKGNNVFYLVFTQMEY